ncbi:MAG: cytochrome c oxidase subunit II [Chloroflexi bacterium]|nr:cytochrome c oxidase subunit II [Chloroflexota bacterium]
MRRDLAVVGVAWLAATALGELLVRTNLYPTVRSDKGHEIVEAFQTLLAFAVPVFTFVLVILVYSILRYRVRGQPDTDGPPLVGRGFVPATWFIVTAALAVTIMIYPGLVNLPTVVEAYTQPDLVVQVGSMQWAWTVTYPQYGITTRSELVLPVDRKIRFDITSADVVHSFWIPAFYMRIDAVPGMTTSVSLRPTRIGSYAEDPNLRLQCSQLCGLGHALMTMPVRVVSQADFDAWVHQQAHSAPSSPSAAPVSASEHGAGGDAR